MYSRFLEEAGRPESSLAADAAARWSELAAAFQAASENDEPDPALWAAVDSRAHSVSEAEERLWSALAAS
jgi:anti-sigma-K factor RskA